MTIVLIDSFNLAFRAHYVYPNLCTSGGVPTSVVYGFLNLAQNLHKLGDVELIFAWEGGYAGSKDAVAQTPVWRKSISAGKTYKANRKPNEHTALIHAQVPIVYRALRILGYTQLSVPGLEADDIVGVISSKLARSSTVDKVLIVSTDRDFFACIDDKTFVLRQEKHKLKTYDAAAVKKEFKIMPEQWSKYRAFTGEATDNFKGIPGVGPVNAAKLVNDGADPSISWNDQEKHIRLKYPELEQYWQSAMDCYILSNMPRSPRYKLFPKECQKALLQQTEDLEVNCRRVFSRTKFEDAVYKFTQFCSKYELNSILANRGVYFKSVKVE